MARFRAILTDSESEAEATNQNATAAAHLPAEPAHASKSQGDKIDSGSESESSQPSPKHQKHTGKTQVRHVEESNRRRSKSRRSKSSTEGSTSEEGSETDSDDGSPPPNQPQRDPSLIPRAQQLGVEPQRMHVMQASLFRPEDDAGGVSTRRRLQAMASSLSLSRKHSRDSDGEGLRQDSQQVNPYLGRPNYASS